jgi:hypothetical protein
LVSPWARRKRDAIIGVSVSDTTIETKIVMVSVTANSRNSRPMMPPISSNGISTATSEMLIDMMVKPISAEPLKAAASGFSPSSIYRVMFSRTTIASSTTNPTEIVNAISDRLSSV